MKFPFALSPFRPFALLPSYLLPFCLFTLLPLTLYPQTNLHFTANSVKFEMVFVEGGSFVMGCTAEQGDCFPGERPSHKVTLSDFLIGEMEVTQELWYAVMGTTVKQQCERVKTLNFNDPGVKIKAWDIEIDLGKIMAQYGFIPLSTPHTNMRPTWQLVGDANNYPMYYVNYLECVVFCERLNELLADVLPEGYKFRLPTEAQWEFAARGGDSGRDAARHVSTIYAGSNNIDDVAWFNINSEKTTHKVGQRQPNELGIFDMSGNVWEWCRDKYNENYYSSSPASNPKGALNGTKFVLRGGSFAENEFACRNATRHKDEVTAMNENYGFRLVLEPPAKLTGSGFFGYTGKFNTKQLASSKNLTFKTNNQQIEMIFVEGGNLYNIKLSNFYLGKFEITQKLWKTVMGNTIEQQRNNANPNWKLNSIGDNFPIYFVNYEECELFCEKLNKLLYYQLPEGYQFIIPTEAQWEYAARGGQRSRDVARYVSTYAGSNKISKVAWWEENSAGKIWEVGKKSKNELGIYDLSGNVWEWCSDWFSEIFKKDSLATNPQNIDVSKQRVLRGGSYNLKAWDCRITNRSKYEPEVSSGNLGFRIALEPAKDFFNINEIKNAQKEQARKNYSANNRSYKISDINLEMIFVKGGSFTMGCTSNPEDCFANEEPTHSVNLSDFYLAQLPITQQLWTEIMGTNIRQQCMLIKPDLVLYGEGDMFPMYYVNYEDCKLFCEKLNQIFASKLPEGYKFALPTEAQWEFAARGGILSKNYAFSGSNNISKVAWYDNNSGKQTITEGKVTGTRVVVLPGGRQSTETIKENVILTEELTSKVGLKSSNELGFFDMSGNVWEWCNDWFDGNYYSISPENDPQGPDGGSHRAMRGGSWRSIEQGCRVSCRASITPNDRSGNVGFRVALVR